jgi:hypothetical protein
MSADPVRTRLSTLLEVEALLAWEQERYREQLEAWRAGGAAGPPPPVPDTYREAVARLQVALGHLSLAAELAAAPPTSSAT